MNASDLPHCVNGSSAATEELFKIDDLGQDLSTADSGLGQDKDLADQMSELDFGRDQNEINNNSDEESFDIVQLKVNFTLLSIKCNNVSPTFYFHLKFL